MERLRGLQRKRRSAGAGVVISLVIHGAVFAAAFFVARGVARVIADEPRPVMTFRAPPPPPPPKGRKRTTPKEKIEKKIVKPIEELVIPKEVPKEVPEPPAEEPAAEDEPEGEEDGVEGGVIGGVVGGVVGGVLGGELGSTLPIPEPEPEDANEAREITMGISTPKILRKVPADYPPAALRAGIEGEVVVKCIIDVRGDVQVVQVLQAPQYLEEAAVRAIKRWKYEPAIYKGRPQAVYLNVRIKFVRPKK